MDRHTMGRMLAAAFAFAALGATAGVLDNAWIKGTTDKDPVSYKVGETMKFTLTPMDLGGAVPEGEYSLWFRRSDDFGNYVEKKFPFDGKPLEYETSMDRPGFVRIEAYVVDGKGKRVTKKFTGDATTPEGRKAMNKFEKAKKKEIFFDGGAGADVAKLAPPEEPKDFDAFWKKQFERLDKVPVKMLKKVELPQKNPKARVYAVSIACADGVRPVTGYLSIPVAVDEGRTFPARLETHGYGGNPGFHMPGNGRDGEIVLNINAHGMELPAFGATDEDLAALKESIKSNGKSYAFDPEQNKDPETAYFNGMVLRVKRALQCLKKIKGWNGKDLYASGGSQGGLQTIWAAGCGEGVTRANSDITWCCDMATYNDRIAKKASSAGWYIPWVPALGYYDAANWAKRIPTSCRTNITRAGLGDYTCPPMGLAKMYNAIPGENKSIRWVQGSEHGYQPPEYPGRDVKWGLSK